MGTCDICGTKLCDCCDECPNEYSHPPVEKAPVEPAAPPTEEQIAKRKEDAERQLRKRDQGYQPFREATDWQCPICDGHVVRKSKGFGNGSDLWCNECGRRLVLTPDLHQQLPLGEVTP